MREETDKKSSETIENKAVLPDYGVLIESRVKRPEFSTTVVKGGVKLRRMAL